MWFTNFVWIVSVSYEKFQIASHNFVWFRIVTGSLGRFAVLIARNKQSNIVFN